MHDSSLDVKAKQKEPAGNIPWKSVRREGLATWIPIKTIFFPALSRRKLNIKLHCKQE